MDAQIEKFLGIIEHAWTYPGDEVCCHTHEINLVFKVTSTELKWEDAVPQQEDHVAFKWIAIDDLREIDLRPLPLNLKFALSQWLGYADNTMFWSTLK